MKFERAGFILVVGIALLSAAFIFSDKSGVVHATEPASWTDGVPNLHAVNEVTGTELANLPTTSCTPMTIPVAHYLYQTFLKNNEQHCMVHAGSGLVDDLVSIYQPSMSDTAFAIEQKPLNGGHLQPIPMQPKALYVTSGLQGSYVKVYNNIDDSFQYNHNLFHPAYTLKDPDVMIRGADGNGVPFRGGTMTFSNDGNYMVGERQTYGFVRIRLSDLHMTVFAGNSPTTITGQQLVSKTAISPSGRYAAVVQTNPKADSPHFRIVDIDSCSDVIAPFDAKTTTCKTYDYWMKLTEGIPGLSDITQLEFASDNSLNFIALKGVFPNVTYERYEMSPAGQTPRLEEYLAMGDSFASGEGTFSYSVPTDTDLNKCHQSVYAYPSLLNAQVGSAESVACSGATTGNIKGAENGQQNNQLIGGIKDEDIPKDQQDLALALHIPGVLKQLDFINKDNPQVVTVSIGGNDVGFSNIIKRCIIPFDNISSTSQNCYQTYEDRKELIDLINSKYSDLVKTYTDLQAGDPTRRVYVIGYPQIVSPTGLCGMNVRMSESDRLFASQLTSYLDSVVERAAAEAGVYYVNTQQALDGHKLCDDGDKAVNGITAGNDHWYGIGNESYHPNKLGHQLLASTIRAATDNLTAPMPASQIIPAPNEDDLEILHAPKTGRLMYNIINGGKDVVFVGTGGILNLYSDSYANIVQPDGVIDTVLHSTPVDLGRLSIDNAGVIHGSVQIPADTVPGFHTLHMYTNNMFGQPIDIQQMLYVGASATDYDGDGILNTDDSCVTVPNSGQDQDQDGIDDACDPEIGPAPVAQPTENNDNSAGDNDTTGQQGSGQTGTPPIDDEETGRGGDTQGSNTPTQNTPVAAAKTAAITNVATYTNKPRGAALFFGRLKAAETTAPHRAAPKPAAGVATNTSPLFLHKQAKNTAASFWYVGAVAAFALFVSLAGRFMLRRAVDK